MRTWKNVAGLRLKKKLESAIGKPTQTELCIANWTFSSIEVQNVERS